MKKKKSFKPRVKLKALGLNLALNILSSPKCSTLNVKYLYGCSFNYCI